MSATQLLAETLTRMVENPDLFHDGVEFTSFRIRVREIELPSEEFQVKLRRPLTLRILHEQDYWLVSDFRTTVWGTGPSIDEALRNYVREWKDQLDWLATRREEMGPSLVADYEKLLRLVA